MRPDGSRAPEQAASRPGRPGRPGPAGTSAGAVLLLFAAARSAAGTGREEVRGRTVAEVLDDANARHGEHFAAVVASSRVWVNGEPAPPDRILEDGDEIAVLPPVSGGAA
jgi:molybdopterin synthase sulfur carrier subunit